MASIQVLIERALVFNVQTGAVVRGPAKKPEPLYQVKVDAEDVLVGV